MVVFATMGSKGRKLKRAVQKAQTTSSVAAKVAELRRRVVESADISDVFDFFEAHLDRCDEFRRLNVRASNEPLVALVRSAVKVSLSLPLHPDALIEHAPEHRLWHGVVNCDGGGAVVIYFEDVQRVCCAVARVGFSRTEFLRFSMPEELDGAVDPDSAQLVSFTRRTPNGAPN